MWTIIIVISENMSTTEQMVSGKSGEGQLQVISIVSHCNGLTFLPTTYLDKQT